MPEFLDPDGPQPQPAYCYEIQIDLQQVDINSVSFQYTEAGSFYYAEPVSAKNWPQLQSDTVAVLNVCSASYPQMIVGGQVIFSPSEYGITISGGTSECFDHSQCSFGQTPTDCELSEWGYGEFQDSWVAGEWSPCTLKQGSYQRFQTRYVVVPAENGGSCDGATIQYESCTPPESGTVPTLTTPTFSQITANSFITSVTVSNTGGSPVTQVDFNIFRNGNLFSSTTLTNFALGIFVEFTGLTPSTAYTVTAVARNSTGLGTSPTGSVSTLAPGSISTPTISDIIQTGATSTSTFTNSGGTSYTKYGVIYKIGNSDNLTVGSPGVVRIETGGLSQQSPTQLVSQLIGLAPSTQYYVRAYVQGETYLYSSTANFTTAGIAQETNLAQLGIASAALPESSGTDESYEFITNPTANQNRSYISTIIPTDDDAEPGVYVITTNFQQVNLTSLSWTLQRKSSPSETNWQNITEVDSSTNLTLVQIPQGWSYYQYEPELDSIKFRPGAPGYYNFMLRGKFTNNENFIINREIIIGNAPSDLELSHQELRQGNLSSIQVVTRPPSQEWIPEFPEDAMYGLTITQTGSSINPTLNINNRTRAFTAIWGISPTNQRILPTLTVNLTSPFKNANLSNIFQKQFPLAIVPPIPAIAFGDPSLFSTPLTSGSTVTIDVSTQYANDYVITSSLGDGNFNNPVTYSAVPTGTYLITATATNDTVPNLQTTTISQTITVAPAAPIVSQLPQQRVGRNKFVDINTLPFVNLNGTSFSNLSIIAQPSHGSVNRTNYTVRYIPNLDYTGTDLFSFRVNSTNGTQSNIINVAVLVAAPTFSVGAGNSTININSTEIGLSRDIVVPILNNGVDPLTIQSISIDQSGEDFKLRVPGPGSTVIDTASIDNIELQPNSTYNVTIRVEPTAIGVRSAKLKIDHN
jgi:hypothetical protein